VQSSLTPRSGASPVPLLAPIGEPSRAFRGWSFALAAGVTVIMVAVAGRVAQLQLAPSQELLSQLTPRVTSRKELALRGDIVDRRGRLLAATRFSPRVIIDPTLISDMDKTSVALGNALGISAESIANKLMWAISENQTRLAALEKAGTAATSAAAEMVTAPEIVTAPDSFNPFAYPTSPDYDISLEPKKLIRYLSIGELMTTEQADAVRAVLADKKLKIRGVSLENHAVRDFLGGIEVANIVGIYGWEGESKTGIESRKDTQLTGVPGKIGFVRDASRTPLWSEVGQIQRAQAGRDLALSFDLEVQRIVVAELTSGVEECDAQGGQAVVIDVNTGEILAMSQTYRHVPGLVPIPKPTPEEKARPALMRAKSGLITHSRNRYIIVRPDVSEDGKPSLAGLGRNRCVEDIYEPGSTFKPFMWSTILETGRLRLDSVVDTEGGSWVAPTGRPIQDVTGAETMTWREVLINSSNIGMIKGTTLLKPKEFRDAILRFGFGSKTGVPLPGESAGIVTSLDKWSVFSHTSMAYGNEVGVTPVQMARAFCVFARDGQLAGTLPRLRTTAPAADESAGVIYRVLPSKIAMQTRETLTHVSASMERKYAKTAPDGTPWKYLMFGKSGTSRPPAPPYGYLQHQYVPSFIGAGPTERPRIVVLVVIDDPGPKRIATRTYYGAATAGPINRRIMERVLTYLGTPPSPLPPAPKLQANGQPNSQASPRAALDQPLE